MKLHKYTNEQLIEAVRTSTSMRQVLRALGVAPYGGNYDVLKKALRYFAIDTSHFRGRAWNKGISLPAKVPIEKYLDNEASIQSYKLKNRLLKHNMLINMCMLQKHPLARSADPLGTRPHQWEQIRQQTGESPPAVSQLPRTDSDLPEQKPVQA